jgi:hypothetical protein
MAAKPMAVTGCRKAAQALPVCATLHILCRNEVSQVKNIIIVGLAALVIVGLGVAWKVTAPAPGAVSVASEPRNLAAGKVLYAETCAACHGADLQGQPDWQTALPDGTFPAPPHDQTGHTWHHDDALLFTYTKLGGAAALAQTGVEGFKSGMPGFGDSLTDAQIWDILA